MYWKVLAGAAISVGSLAFATPADASPTPTPPPCYIASSGDCVPYPQQGPTQPPGATAKCADGTWSFSEHPHSGGTCHGHGGVQTYL